MLRFAAQALAFEMSPSPPFTQSSSSQTQLQDLGKRYKQVCCHCPPSTTAASPPPTTSADNEYDDYDHDYDDNGDYSYRDDDYR